MYSETDVARALEQILEKRDKSGFSPRSAPPGSRLELQTNAGLFECGAVFEAETVKGGTNYVIFGMDYNGFTYYFHGDKAKKVNTERFKSLIDYGDLKPVAKDKVDPERIALAVLNLSAMANGLSFNDYMKVIYGHGEGSRAV
jgi:hypothetical protein